MPMPLPATSAWRAPLPEVLEALVRQFAQGWTAGGRPILEGALIGQEEHDRAPLLARLLEIEWSQRRLRGETPSLEDYRRRFPQDSDVVEEAWRRQALPESPSTLHGASTNSWVMPEGPSTGTDPQRTRSHVPGVGEDSQETAPPAPPLPQVPGFEIQQVLGRGGMGVVYKAYQISLKRYVALKMILAGAHASAGQLNRFRSEAQAAAQLQHPHIVHVHEIGEHQGLPYFSLEYVDGGSLAHLLRTALPAPESAAALMEMLARAMHVSHQRQIVHRDLKPGNVLLAASEPGRGVEWPAAGSGQFIEPKIADFGLAKQLMTESGQTHSGAVLGTPAYMAPEQAEGKIHAIGPATDVYALGAMLYELLTGQPPFRGDTTLVTLRKVMAEDPPSPSRLKPKIPRDLETICLKALAKDPGRRYPSALALAQDLERFRAGEPILGRREGMLGRLLRQGRRRPWTVAAALSVLLAIGLAAFFFSQAQRSSRQAAFTTTFENSMKELKWNAAFLDDMEQLIAQGADPERAAQARTELYQHYARSVRERISPTRSLNEEDIQAVRASLDVLRPRQAELAGVLEGELATRLGQLQTVLTWQAPFQNLAEQTPKPFDFQVADHRVFALTTLPHVVIPLKEPCPGKVELAVQWSPKSWDACPAFGLALNVSGEERNLYYAFLLVPGEALPKEALPDKEMERWRRGRLEIRGHGTLLRQHGLSTTALRPLPVTMRARRDGPLLRLEMLQEEALLATVEFRETIPPVGQAAGTFGLIWPGEVGLVQLQARRQTLPPQPSPLERGDEYYFKKEMEKALQEYRQRPEGLGAEARQESRMKEAMCLLALKRPQDAATVLTPLSQEAGETWPLAAACQLWLLHLLEKQRAEADALSEILLARGLGPQQLALVVPDEVRRRIMDVYLAESTFQILLRPDPVALKGLERMVALHEFLEDNETRRFYLSYRLVRSYRSVGEPQKALDLLQRMLGRDFGAKAHPGSRVLMVEEHGWLCRERGEAEKALNFDPLLQETDHHQLFQSLLVERARTWAALGKFAEAEQDLKDFFTKGLPAEQDYQHYSAACLLMGLLREKQGDQEGARRAWKKGLLDEKFNPTLHRALIHNETVLGGGIPMLQAWMLASLANHLPDADADRLQNRLQNLLPPAQLQGMRAIGFRIPPSVLREAWRSPRARQEAWRLAVQTCSWPEYLRTPMMVLTVEMLGQNFPAAPSAEQQAVLWKLADDATKLGLQGKLSVADGLQLALAWKGALGFTGAPKSMPAEVRGPIAYALGQRYLKLGKEKEAAAAFRVALEDPALEKLSRVELERVGKKK